MGEKGPFNSSPTVPSLCIVTFLEPESSLLKLFVPFFNGLKFLVTWSHLLPQVIDSNLNTSGRVVHSGKSSISGSCCVYCCLSKRSRGEQWVMAESSLEFIKGFRLSRSSRWMALSMLWCGTTSTWLSLLPRVSAGTELQTFIILGFWVIVCVCVCACHNLYVEVRGHLEGVGFLLLPHGSLGLNSGPSGLEVGAFTHWAFWPVHIC